MTVLLVKGSGKGQSGGGADNARHLALCMTSVHGRWSQVNSPHATSVTILLIGHPTSKPPQPLSGSPLPTLSHPNWIPYITQTMGESICVCVTVCGVRGHADDWIPAAWTSVPLSGDPGVPRGLLSRPVTQGTSYLRLGAPVNPDYTTGPGSIIKRHPLLRPPRFPVKHQSTNANMFHN